MSSQPTILIVGATGNTGRGVVQTLPDLVQGKNYRILGLTRSLSSTTSRELASLPSVELVEKNWTEIDAQWLKDQNVVKAFLATFAEPTQYIEESRLLLALLQAGVEYVVRVSTHVKFITPDSPIFYGRSHWALETLLSQPEYAALHWTSLQPTFFADHMLYAGAEWIKAYRKDGSINAVSLPSDEHANAAFINPLDIGDAAAHFLALDDKAQAKHHGQRYVLNGPKDESGASIVALIEKIAGVKVPTDKVTFRNTSWIDYMPRNLRPSYHASMEVVWSGTSDLKGMPTSQAILDLAPPRRTPEDTLRALLE